MKSPYIPTLEVPTPNASNVTVGDFCVRSEVTFESSCYSVTPLIQQAAVALALTDHKVPAVKLIRDHTRASIRESLHLLEYFISISAEAIRAEHKALNY